MRGLRGLMMVFVAASTAAAADVTLDGVLDQAARHGRTAARIEATYRAARARYRELRAGYAPEVRLSADDDGERTSSLVKRLKKSGTLTYSFVAPGDGSASTKQVTWRHPLFRTNETALDEGAVSLAIDRLERHRQLVDFRFRVVRQYYEVLRQQERVAVSRDAVARWQGLLEFARVRFELGTSTKIDVLNAEVNLGTARTDLLNDEQGLAAQCDALADLVGFDVGTAVTATEPLAFTTAPLTVDPTWLREDVAVAELRVTAARLRSREGLRQVRPDVELRSDWSDDGTGDAERTSQLAWSFRLGPRPERWAFHRLQETERVARIDLERVVAEAAIEQRDARRTLERLETSVAIARANVQQAEESQEFSRFSFEKGLVSAIELREAQLNLTRARSNLVNLLIDHRIAGHRYRLAMGSDLE